MASYIGVAPPEQTGIVERYRYTGDGSTTAFSGADANSKTLRYTSTNPVLVFLNGVQLVEGTDFTKTSNTVITFTTAPALNDDIEILTFGSFDLNSPATLREDLSIELSSGEILVGNSSNESAKVTPSGDATISNTGAITVASAAGDFNVTSDLTVDTNTLHVDSTNNGVGIGTTAASISKLNIDGTTDNAIRFTNTGTFKGFIGFAGSGGNLLSGSQVDDLVLRSVGEVVLASANAERIRIDSSGNVGVGTASPSTLLHLSSTNPKITITDTDGTGSQSIFADNDNLYLDVKGALILDGGSQIMFSDDNTNYGAFVYTAGSNKWTIHSQISDADFAINGNDGGTQFDALSFDMSEAGAATFNDKITLGANKVIEFGDAGENISGDGTSLTIASSHNTVIDSANQIIFDAGNGLNIYFRDDGTLIGQVLKSGLDDFKLKGLQNGKSFILEGLDSGGSLVQALTLDMSDAGAATFNDKVILGANKSIEFGDAGENITGDGTDLTISASSAMLIDVGTTLTLDGATQIALSDSGTNYGAFSHASNSFRLTSQISDEDILFRGNDGGSYFTALTLDMSDAGSATFNNNISVGGNATITGNLTVNGTTTTLATTNSVISDRLIELGNGTTGTPGNDMGIVLERGDSDNAFIGWDESADKFIVGTGSFTGASTGNLTITTGTLVANLEGNVTGNVTGNADTATALETARTIAGQSFDGTANITIASTDLSNTSNITLNDATQTLTNKTLTNPTINAATFTGDVNFDSGTLFIDESANRVGIKTTSPNRELHVVGNGTIENSTGDGAFLFIPTSTDNRLYSRAGNASTTALPITFYMGGSERMRIDSSGNVGVGATSPASKLHVLNGDITINSDNVRNHQIGTKDKNIFFGANNLSNLSTGADNTALGFEAAVAVTSGSSNVALGSSSLRQNQTGNYNTASGYCALYTNTASNNTSMGAFSLKLSTGSNNTAIGYEALCTNSTGGSNTALGAYALRNNTTPGNLTAIGYTSLTSNTTGTANVAVGFDSLRSNTTASNNTAVGYQSLYANTTGGVNNAFGYRALWQNTTGTKNIAIGHQAMGDNTIGTSNLGIGYLSLGANTTGTNNVSIGDTTLRCSTTASYNVAIGNFSGYLQTVGCNISIGFESLRNNDLGLYNVAIGHQSLRSNNTAAGSYNTAMGFQALCSNTTGEKNTAVGYQSMYANTTGEYNAAIGTDSLRANTIGQQNVALGHNSLYSNTSGFGQVAAGYKSLFNNTTGNYNVALGAYALENNVSGSCNVAIGFEVLQTPTNANFNVAVGHQSLKSVTSGTLNNAMGSQALFSLQTGTRHVAIGQCAMYSQTGGFDNVAIGYKSLSSVTTEHSNVAIGTCALMTTTGYANVGIGRFALLNSTGSQNVAIGAEAGCCMTNHIRSVIIGAYAGKNIQANASTFVGFCAGGLVPSGDNNTFIGTCAGLGSSSTTGFSNVAVGNCALFSYTTGRSNVAVGDAAMKCVTTGMCNVGIGFNTLSSLTTANCVTAVGTCALRSNTTGNGNVAVGFKVLQANTTGSRNIAVGFETASNITTATDNTVIGSAALVANIVGNANTAVGRQALKDVTGSDNTGLGFYAGYNLTTGSNNIVIGKYTDASAATVSNEITLGNTSHTCLRIPGLDVYANSTGLGVGVTSPSYTLDVTDGTAKIDNLTVGDADEGRLRMTAASRLEFRDGNSFIQESSGIHLYNNAGGRTVRISTSGTERMRVDTSGNVGIGTSSPDYKLQVAGDIVPETDNTYDLGKSTLAWANIYTGDLHLSNENKEQGNDIDGTKGNWTIQEGETDLYIINNKNGKKFKFKLEEIE